MSSRLLWAAACLAAGVGGVVSAQVPLGRPAPAFALRSPEGRPLSLASLRGKVVLLDFWGPS